MSDPVIEKWEDLLPYVRRTRKAVATIPPPPKPDDSYAEHINKLHTAVEGINQCVDAKVLIEQGEEA